MELKFEGIIEYKASFTEEGYVVSFDDKNALETGIISAVKCKRLLSSMIQRKDIRPERADVAMDVLEGIIDDLVMLKIDKDK